MALTVLGDVNGDTDGGGFETPAADFPLLTELFRGHGADELFVSIERSANCGDQAPGGFFAVVFLPGRG
jgi:hypothetical protein